MRTTPLTVTVVPFVVTSIERALIVSSSTIFALIFDVSATSWALSRTFAAATATCSPTSAPRSRAALTSTVPAVPTVAGRASRGSLSRGAPFSS